MSAKKRTTKKQGTTRAKKAAKSSASRSAKKTPAARNKTAGKTAKRRKDELKKLEEQLLQRREELLRELQGGIGSLRKDAASPTGDSADVAMDIMQEDLYSQLAELESQELRRIEHALQRIREGTYGICEECGQPIPAARLKALPYTTLCVKCQAEYEEEYGEGSVYTGPSAWSRAVEMEALAEEEEPEATAESGIGGELEEELEEEEEQVLEEPTDEEVEEE